MHLVVEYFQNMQRFIHIDVNGSDNIHNENKNGSFMMAVSVYPEHQ